MDWKLESTSWLDSHVPDTRKRIHQSSGINYIRRWRELVSGEKIITYELCMTPLMFDQLMMSSKDIVIDDELKNTIKKLNKLIK